MSTPQTDSAKRATTAAGKPSEESRQFSITMDSIGDYEFRVRFDRESYGTLLMDEPPPVGQDKGPNASRILAAAVGNCLSASLLFCAQKAHVKVSAVHTEVKVNYARDERGRLRIGKIEVAIKPQFDPTDLSKAQRCIGLFEDYCVVTQSVRKGTDISVTVQLPELRP